MQTSAPSDPPSDEAIRLNAIAKKALDAATAAFNAVLIEHGIVALDESYMVEATLTFRQQVASPEPKPTRFEDAASKLVVPKGTGCFIHGCEKPATRYLTLVGERGDLAPFCDEHEA